MKVKNETSKHKPTLSERIKTLEKEIVELKWALELLEKRFDEHGGHYFR